MTLRDAFWASVFSAAIARFVRNKEARNRRVNIASVFFIFKKKRKVFITFFNGKFYGIGE